MDSSERARTTLANREQRCIPRALVAFASATLLVWLEPATADGRSGPARSLERCWYVVEETVVPVNLPKVTVEVALARDPSFRLVMFREAAKPNKVLTELLVTADRARELLDSLVDRQTECAGAPQ